MSVYTLIVLSIHLRDESSITLFNYLFTYLFIYVLQSKGLNEESKTHVLLLNKAENDMTIASLALRAETAHAEKLRQARSGVCWMYGVIIAETVLLVLLLYIGLSNS
jgi:hypothetical protein